MNRWAVSELFVADGDAPPERFDHDRTLIGTKVLLTTPPNFLRKNGLDPMRCPGQITALVGHRSARLPGPLSNPAVR